MGKLIAARSMRSANTEMAKVLYDTRALLVSKLEYLRAYEGSSTPTDNISELVDADEATISEIESKLRQIGLPPDPTDLFDHYGSVASALQTLRTSQEVVSWIKQNFPSQYRRNIPTLDGATDFIEARMTGKWNGAWRSHTGFLGGNIALAICQIGGSVFGSGALSNSLYTKAYVEGSVAAESLEIQLYSDDIPETCSVTAAITAQGDIGIVRGEYRIHGYDEGDFTIRRLPYPATAKPPKPSRVLAVFANPKGTSALRLGVEDRVLRECIRLSRDRDLIHLDIRHASQVHDVRRALLDDEYDIVHFSGHGTSSGLLLEDESGNAKLLPPTALADLISAYSPPIQCVVLNACYSAEQGVVLAGAAPHVIAMEQGVSDDGAIEFSRGFYDAIGAGKDIAFAYQEGCRTAKLMGFTDEVTPVIFN